MTGFSVLPEELRSTATKVDRIAEAMTANSLSNGPEAGHQALDQAISDFVLALDESWRLRGQATSATALNLRMTADLYEDADSEGESAAQTASGGV